MFVYVCYCLFTFFFFSFFGTVTSNSVALCACRFFFLHSFFTLLPSVCLVHISALSLSLSLTRHVRTETSTSLLSLPVYLSLTPPLISGDKPTFSTHTYTLWPQEDEAQDEEVPAVVETATTT